MTEPVSVRRIEWNDLSPVSPQDGGWTTVDGDATAHSRVFVENAAMRSGIMTYGPCTAREVIQNHSSIHILDGELTVTDEHGEHRLGPGDIAFFAPGQDVTITSRTRVREVYTTCGPF
ncbi:hypothetical protein nbrc107696_09860 [Gordonia spumicola]|uniref:(S)-ureidoglycine aminohydrolase cupin domain-containing protein n=1 Tax=Gordonia spumicola TaxID=589161 RepID=A0A7I9V633_9ACTN|nr:cupin domain-containing protein [Gordonia spumicola]GEE00540.1 hypothetical protein nbrc107696_09860 [Gordonia spumicola]